MNTFSMDEMLAFIANTPEMGCAIRADARIIYERIGQERLRHATTMHEIREAFDLDCWRKVKANWTSEEIESALWAERHHKNHAESTD